MKRKFKKAFLLIIFFAILFPNKEVYAAKASSSSKTTTTSTSTSSKSTTTSSTSSTFSVINNVGLIASGSVPSGSVLNSNTSYTRPEDATSTSPSTTVVYVTQPPTPTPIPKLMEFNNSMVDNLKDKAPIDIDVMKKNNVLRYFNLSKTLGRTFVIIGVMASVVALFFSGDFFTAAKLKLVLRDFAFSFFMLATMYYWVTWAITGSNLFYALWDPSFSTMGLLTASGIGVIAAVINPSLLVFVVVCLVLVFLYQVVMSTLIYLLEAAVILLPIFQALFPINVFKKAYMSIMSLIFTLLAIYPLQNLFILLAKSTLLNNTLSVDSVAGLLGLLIVIVIVIPGAAMAGFMKIFQLINN